MSLHGTGGGGLLGNVNILNNVNLPLSSSGNSTNASPGASSQLGRHDHIARHEPDSDNWRQLGPQSGSMGPSNAMSSLSSCLPRQAPQCAPAAQCAPSGQGQSGLLQGLAHTLQTILGAIFGQASSASAQSASGAQAQGI